MILQARINDAAKQTLLAFASNPPLTMWPVNMNSNFCWSARATPTQPRPSTRCMNLMIACAAQQAAKFTTLHLD